MKKLCAATACEVFRRQAGIENEFFLFEQRLDFLQRLALGLLRLAAQARFHKFQVLQNHVRPAFHRHRMASASINWSSPTTSTCA